MAGLVSDFQSRFFTENYNGGKALSGKVAIYKDNIQMNFWEQIAQDIDQSGDISSTKDKLTIRKRGI